MSAQTIRDTGLYCRQGGEGAAPRLLLLHGLGATNEVWGRVTPSLRRRWLAPDLRGHGRSPRATPYSYGTFAADVATLLDQDEEIVIAGHSLGGVIGMMLAGGAFGLRVSKVVAIGVKLRWTPDEIARLGEIASAPARRFDTREESVARYLKVSGLAGLVGADDDAARSGVTSEGGKWLLAADPLTNASAGPDLNRIIELVTCPLRLGAGDADPMADVAAMSEHDPDPFLIENAGHNAHVEQPDALLAVLERELGAL